MLTVRLASNAERQKLSPVRALAWRGLLTVEQFCERNECLTAHPFGKNHIKTHLLVCDDEIVASLDELTVPMLLRTEDGVVESDDGFLIASVITPPELRGNGHASELLKSVFEKLKDRPGVLYSDIDPKFYSRFGFVEHPVVHVEHAVDLIKNNSPGVAKPLTLAEFIASLKKYRQNILQGKSFLTAAICPNELFWDWHLERYRFFAKCFQKQLPHNLFWQISHQEENHFVAAVPNFISNALDVLWVTPECKICSQFLNSVACDWNLKSFGYWDHRVQLEGHRERPMIRLPQASAAATFVDPQLGDWW